MAYAPQVQPFRSRVLADGFVLATSQSGDHAFCAPDEFDQFRQSPQLLSLRRLLQAGQSHSRPAAWVAASIITGQSTDSSAYDRSTSKT